MTTWILLRAAGIGAYVMLFLSAVWGLASTTGVLGKKISKPSMTTIHAFMATCALVLLGVHIGGLLVDTYTPFSVADITIPMSSAYRPVAVTFGVVAMYFAVFVVVMSWIRKRIGTTWWRRTHLLAVPTFTLSMVHGIFAGTDSPRPVVWWMYLGTGLIVLFLVVVRGLTAAYRPRRAAAPARARPARVAAGTEPTGEAEPASEPEPAAIDAERVAEPVVA